MPVCKNCQHTFTWKESYKMFGKWNSEMACPNCAAKQYVTKKTKIKSYLLNVLMLVIPFTLLYFAVPILLVVAVLFGITIVGVAVHPLLIELENKVEY